MLLYTFIDHKRGGDRPIKVNILVFNLTGLKLSERFTERKVLFTLEDCSRGAIAICLSQLIRCMRFRAIVASAPRKHSH